MATEHSQSGTIPLPHALTFATPEVVRKVVEATQELFAGPVSVEQSRDPEYPLDELTVITVETARSIEDLVALECEWIHRVAGIVPGLGTFRLAITQIND